MNDNYHRGRQFVHDSRIADKLSGLMKNQARSLKGQMVVVRSALPPPFGLATYCYEPYSKKRINPQSSFYPPGRPLLPPLPPFSLRGEQ